VICLSFDTDHVDDARLREFLELVQLPGRATFFCTQRFACLEATGHELCAHPYLEPGGDWDAVLATARSDFPDATGWRSHSCVYSHMLGLRLAHEGYVYASTQAELGRPAPQPYREAWGLWQVPIYYMDNLDFSLPRFWDEPGHVPFAGELIDRALANDGVYVFDFHPVHVLLNSPHAEWYLSRREALAGGAPLTDVRYDGYGAGSFLDELCARLRAAGAESHALREAVTALLPA
jgi:hypothetical protein